jgi:iron(III) transport system substrate-binding protein
MNKNMPRFSRRFFLGGGAAALAITLTPRRGKTQQGGELNLYSSRHYNTDDQLYSNFASETGIRINLIEADADALIERIKSEGVNSPADILMTVDAGRLWRASQEGLYAPVESQILTQSIPASLREPSNLWFGFSKRARVIMYNKNTVDPSQLSTYEALADPQWRGKIAVRSSSNIYNQSLVAGLIEVLGEPATEEWCKGLVANFARPAEGNDVSQIESIAAGMNDLTIANTYYLARFAEEKDPAKQAIAEQVGVFFPNQNDRGTHVNVSGAGVTVNSPNRENAIAFLEYLASPSAQEFFALGNNEYPVVEGTPISPAVESFGDFKEDAVNVAAYGKNSAAAVKIMDRSGWK